MLCPKPHGWNPAWHAQSRGTAANSPWTNPSHGFCPEAASSSPKGRNFSLHYTRRVLNTEMSPKITDTKQHLLDWHSSYSKSSVGRAALDPLLNGSFKFHSQSTERNNIPCGIIWHHRFHYWFNLFYILGLVNCGIFSISLYLKFTFFVNRAVAGRQLCVWGSNQEYLKPWQEMPSFSQQQNTARKFLDHINLILTMQYSPGFLQVRKLQLLNHMACSACSRAVLTWLTLGWPCRAEKQR